MRLLLIVCLPVFILLGGCRSQKTPMAGPAKPDPEAILGTWIVLSFDVDGKASGELEKTEFIFTDKTVTLKRPKGEVIRGTTPDGRVISQQVPETEMNGTYRIEPGTTPKELDLKLAQDGKEKNWAAIYSLEKNVLSMGITKKEGERPTTWTEPGVGVLTLKRVK
jgi:uncharacterized protein (TIGR03067 family)